MAPRSDLGQQHCLVTGGGGFLGRAIVEQLLARGDRVTILARNAYPELQARGARCVQADLQDLGSLQGHFEGVDLVFHSASKTGVWGPAQEFHRVNVDGTRHLIEACWAQGVPKLVYTSSPSATFNGRDAENATEADCPYPEHFEAPYPQSKAAAEKLVLQTNNSPLCTTVLRPHLIYGPRDPHIVPRLIQRRRQGRLRRVGSGHNKVGITFVDNAAVAHLQAADALAPGSPNAGKAYFVTDTEPVLLWAWIDRLLQGVGEAPIAGSVSPEMARRAGSLLEWTWRTFGLRGEPPMTRFVASELATSHWYDLGGARRDFGYQPLVDGDEGLRRTIAWFKAHPVA